MIRKSNTAKIVIITLLISGVSAMGWRIAYRPKPSEAVSISAIRQKNGIPVTVSKANRADWEYWLPLYGTVRTSGLSEVYASQAEYVVSILAEVGDQVKKGQPLATLDTAKVSEKVQAAQARYDELSLKYARLKELRKAGGTSQQELESTYSQYRDAEATLKQLKTELTRHKVVSPIDGVIMQRNAEIGLLSNISKPLFVIGDPKLFEIEIGLSPRYIHNVKSGEKAVFQNVDEKWEQGTVKRVDPMADAQTGLYSVILAVESTRLNVGASVQTRIRIENAKETLSVPYESIREIEGIARIYIASGDTAWEKIVEKGRTDDQGRTRILEGLQGSEKIIIKGADRMYDGAHIWIQGS